MNEHQDPRTFSILSVKTISLLLLLIGGLSVCGLGGGTRFVSSGDHNGDLLSPNGVWWIIPGNALLDHGQTIGPEENLLYLIVLCPNVPRSALEHGTGTTYGRRTNTYLSIWETATGQVSVAVKWDKCLDKVFIDKQQFDRTNGDIFVVIRQATGNLVSTQLPNPGAHISKKALLGFVKQHMTNEPSVASAQLPE